MPNRTTLATGQITTTDTFTVELMEPFETLAVILIHWPGKPHGRGRPTAAGRGGPYRHRDLGGGGGPGGNNQAGEL